MSQELLRLSPSARYALQGLIHLAEQSDDGYCMVNHSAEHSKLPKDFLAKIFQRLAHKGLLHSKRGPGGGYALSRDPKDIYLKDVLACLEDGVGGPFQCALEERLCDTSHPCVLHPFVIKAAEILNKALDDISLEDLVEGKSHDLL